ncbi:MAG: YolD-like family protein [Oscillospiraceae bacterium]|nr:YolD-like family protein [Oscillospiraceae bacterium]
MAEAIRAKMPPSQRAKQFAPFDALSGLGAALERKRRERERTERPILPEERCADLNDALCALQPDDRVTARYYRRGAQRVITGYVAAIDGVTHTLTIGVTRIAFADLLDLQRL